MKDLESRLNALERVFAPPEKMGEIVAVFSDGSEKVVTAAEGIALACENVENIAYFEQRPPNGKMGEWIALLNVFLQ